MPLIEIDALDDGDDDLPLPDSVEIMETIDSMPKAWRLLVYEFGYKIVEDVRASFSARTARAQLEAWRRNRQEEWPATNFITSRSRRGFEFLS